MNVLFVNHFGYVDYLNDHVYEGFIRQPNTKVWETSRPSYMLKGGPDMSKWWGRGVGYGHMRHSPNIDSPDNIKEKILNSFYDIVVYGSIHRCRDYWDDVIRVYPKNKIIMCDGEDHQGVEMSFTKHGLYFKRELVQSCSSVLPISFAATKYSMAKKLLEKTQMFGTCIPGDPSTYKWSFDTQKGYYKDYNRSFYGITMRKVGWDCNRHYEILASHCVPYFIGLEDCPSLTMTTFPKKKILEANKWAAKKIVPSNYKEIVDELFQYTKENLTTEKMVYKMILSKI